MKENTWAKKIPIWTLMETKKKEDPKGHRKKAYAFATIESNLQEECCEGNRQLCTGKNIIILVSNL